MEKTNLWSGNSRWGCLLVLHMGKLRPTGAAACLVQSAVRAGSQTRTLPLCQGLCWLGPCGSQDKRASRGRHTEGPCGEGSGGSTQTKPGASDVLCFSALWSPAAPKGPGPVASVTSEFSLDNPLPCVSASIRITPPLMTHSHLPAGLGPSPTHFPSQCGCCSPVRVRGPGRQPTGELSAPVTAEAQALRPQLAAAPGAGARLHSGAG